MPPQRSTPVEIRQAKPADATAIAHLLFESFSEFRPLYTDAGFAATALGVDLILARMQEGPVWIAVRHNEVLGTVSAVVKEASAYIRGMAVLPASRGSGTGSKLLQQAEDWAATMGCSRLFLNTTPFLDSAIHLYNKSGFRHADADDLFGTPLITMEKIIVPQPHPNLHFSANK